MDFLNKNYKNYLDKKEKILLHMTQDESFIFLYLLGIFGVAFLFAFLFTVFVASKLKMRRDDFLILFSAFNISLFVSFIYYFKYKAVQYLITENGIYKIFGLLNKKVKFVSYKKITDNALSVNIFESLFNIGTIKISTAGGVKSGNSQPYELIIEHVKDFNKTNKLITKHI